MLEFGRIPNKNANTKIILGIFFISKYKPGNTKYNVSAKLIYHHSLLKGVFPSIIYATPKKSLIHSPSDLYTFKGLLTCVSIPMHIANINTGQYKIYNFLICPITKLRYCLAALCPPAYQRVIFFYRIRQSIS